MSALRTIHAPDLGVEVQKTGDETVVHCTGNITWQTCTLFQNTTRALISEGKCIVLDLSTVSLVDSAGLGVLVGLWSSAKKRSAEVDIRWPEPRNSRSGSHLRIDRREGIRSQFRLSRLGRLFGFRKAAA